jgi:hypothetical protein
VFRFANVPEAVPDHHIPDPTLPEDNLDVEHSSVEAVTREPSEEEEVATEIHTPMDDISAEEVVDTEATVNANTSGEGSYSLYHNLTSTSGGRTISS